MCWRYVVGGSVRDKRADWPGRRSDVLCAGHMVGAVSNDMVAAGGVGFLRRNKRLFAVGKEVDSLLFRPLCAIRVSGVHGIATKRRRMSGNFAVNQKGIRMRQRNWMRKTWRGSYTVEAVFLFPILVFLLAFLLSLSISWYETVYTASEDVTALEELDTQSLFLKEDTLQSWWELIQSIGE